MKKLFFLSVAIIMLTSCETREKRSERIAAEVRPFFVEKMKTSLKNLKLGPLSMEGVVVSFDSDGFNAGEASCNSVFSTDATISVNLEIVSPYGVENKANWAELSIVEINKSKDFAEKESFENYIDVDNLDQYGLLETKSQVLSFVYNDFKKINSAVKEESDSQAELMNFDNQDSFESLYKEYYSKQNPQAGVLMVVHLTKENLKNGVVTKKFLDNIGLDSKNNKIYDKYYLFFASNLGSEWLELYSEINKTEFDNYLSFYKSVK